MTEKITFTYDNGCGVHVVSEAPEDYSLTCLMARFIDLTRMMGFHAGSWRDVFERIAEDGGLSDNYTAFDWAFDTLCDDTGV